MINTDSKLIFADLTYRIRGALFSVFNNLGYGHKEQVYQKALAKEFETTHISFKREVPLDVHYKDEVVGNYRPDFVVEDKVIVELKAVSIMPKSFETQLLHYLKTTGFSLGLLVNFCAPHLGIRRLVWSRDPRESDQCKSASHPRKSLPIILAAFMFITMFGFTNKAYAVSKDWSGGSSGEWNTSGNWTPSGVPTSSDDITIDNAAVTATTTAINFSTLTIGSGVNTSSLTLTTNIGTGGSITINNNGTLTQNNKVQQTISGTLLINSGGTLTHTANTTANTYNVNFSAANINLDGTGTINVNGKGYSANNGTGTTTRGTYNASGGAGYGGAGGDSYNGGYNDNGGITYGSLTAPDDLGSASGNSDNSAGASGGGLVKLNITGTLTVAGIISANGNNGGTNAGGGAGGGINITAGTFTGSGSITANGGSGSGSAGGSGGGGRIAIIYNTDSSSLSSLSAISGGTGYQKGGAGTIYKATQAGASRTLTVDNNSNTNAGTPIPSSTTWTIDTLNINNAGDLQVPSGTTFTLTGTISTSGSNNYFRINTGTATWPTTFSLSNTLILDVDSGSTFNSSSIALTIANGGTLQLNDTTQLTFSSITVQSGGTINHTANTTSKLYNVNLDATTLTINDGGSINTNGKGYSSGNGQGTTSRTTYNATGGAGYGGAGGQGYNGGAGSGGISNGSLTTPNDLGSASGASDNSSGANGGGLVQLSVTGTLTVNGSITANGSNGGTNAGGGSGGTVNITSGTFAGTGSVTVNGGNGGVGYSGGGGGGGGRIAISATTNTYTGSFTSTGGAGGATGGGSTTGLAGTIYFGTPTFDNVSVAANTNYNNTITGVKTVSFWVKPTTTSPGLIQLSSGVEISATDNTISTTGITSPTVYVNGSVSSTLTQNSWNYVTVTTETGITADSILLGKMSSASLTGQIDDVRVLSTPLSSTQVTNLYNYTVVLSNITTGNPASEEKTEGPVVYYKFDEGQGQTAKDSTSNKNDGTLGSSVNADSADPTWVTEDQCISGKCLKFDGSNDRVTITDAAAFDIGATNGLTLGAWVRMSGSTQTILSNYNTTRDYYSLTIDANGKAAFALRGNADVPVSITGTTAINDNKWHYISGVRDNSSDVLRLYVDGKSDASTVSDTSNSQITPTASLKIGANQASDGSGNYTAFLQGFIDEPKIYPYARSSAQILADYNSKGTQMGVSASIGSQSEKILSDGLVGYWKMDEASANTCTGGVNDSCDSSGNNNNGAWNGDATTAAGKFGNGVTFDGTGDYIDTNYSLPANNEVTFSVWIKTTIGGWYMLGNHYTSGMGFLGNLSGTNFATFRYRNQSGGETLVDGATTNIKDGNWHHLVGTASSTNGGILYVDGKIESTHTTPSGITGGAIYIATQNGSVNFYNGQLDEARIYNRALSPAEVRQLADYAPGPVLHLNMDQKVKGDSKTLTDSSGLGNNGTTVDGANNTGMDCSNKPGKYGGGCEFDGTDDNISVGDTYDLRLTNGGTIAAWINPKAYSHILEKYWDTSGYKIQYTYATKSNQIVFTAGGQATYSNTAINLNKWNHVAITFNSSGRKIYINGVDQTDTGGTNTALPSTTEPLNIGSRGTYNPSDYFNGLLDEVKIYNYTRTAKQIVEDMNAGHPAVGSPVGSAVGHWRFDEGYGQTANNSGNGGSALNGTFGANSGSSTDDPTWSTSGKFGKALSFDGGDSVTVSDSSALDITGNITINGWIKLNTVSVDYQSIAVKRDVTATEVNYGLRTGHSSTNGRDEAQFYYYANNSWQAYETTNANLQTDTWYHITATFDGSSIKIYKNGVLLNGSCIAGTCNVALVTDDNSLVIGRAGDKNDQFFNGSLDEVKIYNYALTSDEVKTEYNHGVSEVLGAKGNNTNYASGAKAQEYCIPGDTSACTPPVGEWNFDPAPGGAGQVVDTSGNNNTGTWYGTGSHWTTGKVGKAGNFNGSDDYVQKTDETGSVLDITGAMTLETWIKMDSSYTPNISHCIVGKGSRNRSGSSGGPYQICWTSSSNLEFEITDTTTGDYLSFGNPSKGVWHHLAGVFDGTNLITYLDGVKVNSKVSSVTTIKTNNLSFWIDRNQYNTSPFNGSIDQVRIFNYARTPAQIAWDYNRGDPIAHYKMDECQGVVIHDSANLSADGSRNNGTLNLGSLGQTAAGTCSESGSTAWYSGRSGKRNYSLNFDGQDDYVSIGDTDTLDNTSQRITITAWIKASSLPGNSIYSIIDKHTNSYLFSIAGTSNGLDGALRVSKAGIQSMFRSAVAITAGQWQHVAMTRNGTGDTFKFYINGVDAGKVTLVGAADWETNNNNIRVGSRGSDNEYFNGQIDDVKIFNYALTPSQVKEQYNGGAVRFSP